ncbi:hypothetical protein [Shimia biformata]|uniref:hypothetical protein n=1 Tax=Shimia biformata TaxID=1294299 RepID=UPI0019510AE8|nr:hypothetical protein [Shimia biformata]
MRMDNGSGRRVIVHCGAQKTGSTAFHHFVQQNHERLRGRVEIRTPQKGTVTRDLGRTCALFSLDLEAHEDALVALIQQIGTDVAATDCTCIISHENIVGAMMGRSGVTTLYPALPKIIALFEKHLAPVQPVYVIYTRDMGAWKKSVHNQAVKSDSYAGTQAQFLAETEDCGTWEQLEQDLVARLGRDRVVFFRLEDEPAQDRPGQQLLRLAGLSEAEIATLDPVPGRRNESLNPGALEFMRQMNGLGLGRPARRQVAALIKKNPALFAEDIHPASQPGHVIPTGADAPLLDETGERNG